MNINFKKKIYKNLFSKNINTIIKKQIKIFLKKFYVMLTISNSVLFLKKSNLEKIKRYKKLLSISQKFNSNFITKKITQKLESKLCLDIGILYGDIHLTNYAKYYLSLYSQNIKLPIIEYRKYVLIKSKKKFFKNTLKRFDLKIICVFYDDSNLF